MNKKIKAWILENKYLLLVFLITTIFFIAHRFLIYSWDYSVYVLNAKHFFNNGFYFEILRPPLVPIAIGILGNIFGYFLADILFIVLVSSLFLWAVYLLTKELKINTLFFYILLLTPTTLAYGLFAGTELLFLTLILFAIYFLIKNNYWAGALLGLAALTRYTGMVLGILILFLKSTKKKVIAAILFVLAFVPWFIYNKINYGNFFTSIADQYYQNITYRQEIIQAPQISHILFQVSVILAVLFVLCLIYLLIKSFKRKIRFDIFKKIEPKHKKALFIIILISIYTLYNYLTTPLKDQRYLFLVVLFFSVFFYGFFLLFYSNLPVKAQKIVNKNINLISLIIFIVTILAIVLVFKITVDNATDRDFFYKTIEIYKNQDLPNCNVYSNYWVYVNEYYLSKTPIADILCMPINYANRKYIWGDNSAILIYKFDYDRNILNNSLIFYDSNIIYEDNNIIIIDNNCKSKVNNKSGNVPFVIQIDKAMRENYDYGINTNPCNIIFKKHKFFEKSCNFINFNGFYSEGS